MNEPLGLPASSAPETGWVTGIEDLVDFEIGGAHACALDDSGIIYCWGFRNEGQLGDGTTEPHIDPAPVIALEGDLFSGITAGNGFNCASTVAQRIACWGDNGDGQVGDGTGGESSWEQDRTQPVAILEGAMRVEASGSTACALMSAGEVRCWGSNLGGATGTGTPTGARLFVPSPEPVAIPEGVGVVDLQASVGGSHICVMSTEGRVLCWGANSHGQLGFGSDLTTSPVPVEAGGIDDATGIAAGGSHTCAIRDGHEVWCWGDNENGQLGDGTRENRNLPVRVVGLD
jgi:alpha-tubulin suppressor-like RCC1 family protein